MIPLWLKLGYTAMVAVIVPIYFVQHGARNFLWFSDIALIVMVPALWLESSLLASMMTLAVLLPEMLWNLSYLGGLFLDRPYTRLAGYMFDDSMPRWLRGLSLFHIFLPPVLLYTVWRLGYERQALLAQSLLAWVVLPLTYRLTDRETNINWVYGPAARPQNRLHPLVYLLLLMLFFPLCVYLPTHFLLLLWLSSGA